MNSSDEPAEQAVGERRDRAGRAGGGGQRVGAEPARERRDPAVADDADDAIDRQQDRDRGDLNAERRRIERQHDVDQRVAEPDQAKAGRRDHGVANSPAQPQTTSHETPKPHSRRSRKPYSGLPARHRLDAGPQSGGIMSPNRHTGPVSFLDQSTFCVMADRSEALVLTEESAAPQLKLGRCSGGRPVA